MNIKLKIITLIIVVLLVVSVSYNINQYNKSKRTDHALYEVAINNRLSKYYKLSSLNESLKEAISDRRMYVGPIGTNRNYLQTGFNNMETIQSEFLMLYNTLHPKDHMDLSAMSNTNFTLFDSFQNISIYFDHLFNNHNEHILNDGERHYFTLDEKEVDEIQIISNILDELVIISQELGTEKYDAVKDRWELLMVQNEEFIASQDTQLQLRIIVDTIILNNQ